MKCVRLYYFFQILFFLAIILSCRKNDSIIDTSAPSSFSEVFDNFWNKMNINYVYWDIDTTNWDRMYIKYKPIFAQLDLNNSDDVKKSVQNFKEMTSGLIDNHYYINFINPSVIDYTIYPSYDRKKDLPAFHYPYLFYKVDTSYLDPGYFLGFDNTNSFNGVPLITLCGTINHNVLFFSCNHFNLYKSYHGSANNSTKSSIQYFFNQLDNLPLSIKGIIIDVRSNHGGDLSDLNFLLGHLIDKPLHFGFTQYKSGNGRLDFTPWVKAFINPPPNTKKITIPIIVLADNVSASLSEVVVMAIHALPNGIFVGETTYGATGPLIENSMFCDGSFSVQYFLSVQTSSCKFKYLDGIIYENKGFSPDVTSLFNFSAIQNSIDSQLEKAISLIQDK